MRLKERGLVFKYSGRAKQPLKEVYKHSTQESIQEFEQKLISEEIFRDRARVKKQRDLMTIEEEKKLTIERDIVILQKSRKKLKKELVTRTIVKRS